MATGTTRLGHRWVLAVDARVAIGLDTPYI
jgi:hypothetical protein